MFLIKKHQSTGVNLGQPECSTVVYRLINNGKFVFYLCRQNTEHVRIYGCVNLVVNEMKI